MNMIDVNKFLRDFCTYCVLHPYCIAEIVRHPLSVNNPIYSFRINNFDVTNLKHHILEIYDSLEIEGISFKMTELYADGMFLSEYIGALYKKRETYEHNKAVETLMHRFSMWEW